MMLKKTLLFLCLTPMFAFAQMSITANEQVSKELNPDVLRSQTSFEEESKLSTTIEEHLNALVAEVKRFDSKGEFCRGGGYHLSPRYSYKDQKQTFIGYRGALSFDCEFTSIEQFNTLFAKLDKIKAPSVHVNQGALSWGVSTHVYHTTQLALRAEILALAQKQAKAFSHETSMLCSVSSVIFEGAQPIRPMTMDAMRLKSTVMSANNAIPTQAPLEHTETLSLSATVGYSCDSTQ
ncbi:MAG: SIMPL domain-containing protein [Sulfurospirillaceae bacterium]|nr:SIMPL domain-containing protein [Sulfurospirillaceae bacterium]